MSYVISSTRLDVDYRKAHIFDLLDSYTQGRDIKDSKVAEWGRKTLKAGKWWYGVEKLPQEQWEPGIQERQKKIIALYEHIRENGYNGSEISIYFDKTTGQVHTYDGYHRLSIIDYLGVEANCNCVVSHHHPTRADMRGDFPLTKRLQELNKGEVLYQPLEDPRVDGWRLWRPDSQQRLKIVTNSLIASTVLDVGCETGWFSRELARRGYQVTGLDSNPKRLAISRYLSIIRNVNVELQEGKWHLDLQDKTFDNILMLSVLHHDILECGIKQTFRRLKALRGKCNRLIVEMPLTSKTVKWLPSNKKDLWSFTLHQFIMWLREATKLEFLGLEYAQLKDRPIITMGLP